MKTTISTVRYKQVTNFLQNCFYFRNMIFCIERELFCQDSFIIGENSLLFGMSFSVPFASRSLVSADFPRHSAYLFSWVAFFLRMQEYFLEYWVSILKEKLSVILGKRKCSYKKNTEKSCNSWFTTLELRAVDTGQCKN